MGDFKYLVNLRWSDGDAAWIAEVFDLPGCLADGKTEEEALKAAAVIAGEWIESAKAWGREVPAPSRTI